VIGGSLFPKSLPLLLQEFLAATDNAASAVGPHHLNPQFRAGTAVSRGWAAACLGVAKLFIFIVTRFSALIPLLLKRFLFGTNGFS
jgi:hypothetical protein